METINSQKILDAFFANRLKIDLQDDQNKQILKIEDLTVDIETPVQTIYYTSVTIR